MTDPTALPAASNMLAALKAEGWFDAGGRTDQYRRMQHPDDGRTSLIVPLDPDDSGYAISVDSVLRQLRDDAKRGMRAQRVLDQLDGAASVTLPPSTCPTCGSKDISDTGTDSPSRGCLDCGTTWLIPAAPELAPEPRGDVNTTLAPPARPEPPTEEAVAAVAQLYLDAALVEVQESLRSAIAQIQTRYTADLHGDGRFSNLIKATETTR